MAKAKGKGTYDYNSQTGLWRWRYYVKDPVTGVNRQKALYAITKKELQEKIEIWLAEVEGGSAGVEMSLNTWAKVWLDKIVGDTVKIRTKEIYEYILDHHILPFFGTQKISKINGMQVQEHLNNLRKKYSATTVSKVRRYFSMILECAVKYGYISLNPVKLTRPPREEQKEIIALNHEQTEAIIKTAKKGEYQKTLRKDKVAEYLRQCYYTFITLAIDTGMREGELGGLKWEDIKKGSIFIKHNLVYPNNGDRHLDTPKTKNSVREVILTKRSIKILEDWKKYQDDFAHEFAGFFTNKDKMVFTTSAGSYFNSHIFLRRCWNPICKQLGLTNTNFHLLRHAHASQLIAAGVDIHVVSKRLGHSSLAVTLKIYAHLLPNQQEAEMDKINQVFS